MYPELSIGPLSRFDYGKAEDIFSRSFAYPRYCAQILLDPIFKSLGLAELMASIKHNSKINTIL